MLISPCANHDFNNFSGTIESNFFLVDKECWLQEQERKARNAGTPGLSEKREHEQYKKLRQFPSQFKKVTARDDKGTLKTLSKLLVKTKVEDQFLDEYLRIAKSSKVYSWFVRDDEDVADVDTDKLLKQRPKCNYLAIHKTSKMKWHEKVEFEIFRFQLRIAVKVNQES